MKSKFKGFSVSAGRYKLKAKGILQPTARSAQYTVEVIYHLNGAPEVSVLDPVLQESANGEAIPHIYPGKKLCLYRPKYGEFKSSDLLADTILPWASLWLYHYENWHATGEWMGGGEHPNSKSNSN
ncbi:hypothetical protein SY85_24385 [Flavisolibacter tropicus]|uniref:Type II CBASS E2 protein domain-containing protein n=1 Tax=Flavisolibacter tropicus TaxID=1492898 RepID=A0A172U3J7_9BACT|nr:hypothetical protein SY85_24385 [Flavisolibacter tropicus]